VSELQVAYRPNTTDVKVIEEVLEGNEYQKKKIGFVFEPDDVWLDLGANIGTFALFALSVGGSVLCVEPEPTNAQLLRHNLHQNFPQAKHRGKYQVLECGVAKTSGSMALYLCNGDYNKYRHSMVIHKNRSHAMVPVQSLRTLWNLRAAAHPSRKVNAIKMDIEGMEIELLEAFGDQMSHLRKLVFEYTFDADPSIPRFMAIINKLKQSFTTVHFTRVNPKEKEYTFYPPCTTVFCINN
jgi:FkbM family methyltransferase